MRHDMSAFRRERARRCAADAAGRAGDEDALSGETRVHGGGAY
jgi:hypothetical protein